LLNASIKYRKAISVVILFVFSNKIIGKNQCFGNISKSLDFLAYKCITS